MDNSQPSANDTQVGGTHYHQSAGHCPHCHRPLQHWDLVQMFGWGYFVGQITKYLMRYRLKHGVQDLEKSRHFLDKLIEIERGETTVVGTRSNTTADELGNYLDSQYG